SKEIASARVDRVNALLDQLDQELEDPEAALKDGALAVVWRFITNRRNPSLARELVELELRHCLGPTKSPAAQLVADIRSEAAGER
ncbi:MAG TPA: hypothetical protein VFC93_12200, partial [Chloroflexota bacterium]|nr:hypothetical protein [Chloroflexota bacterium]